MPESTRRPPVDDLARMPKVVLHDHLDGGLRPGTLIDLADAAGYSGLPTHDPAELERAIRAEADRKSLPLYLEPFRHTIAVLQTPEALTRVAEEAAADLAADGVAYAELRFAPESHLLAGLGLDDAIEAVLAGLRVHSDRIRVGLLCTILRHRDAGIDVAEAAARHAEEGVVGVDLAGPESGYPATDHIEAIEVARTAGLQVTIHAGEAAGPASIDDALSVGANRIGHGVRIIDDIGGHPPDGLGPVARLLLDEGVALELCPTSNVHTGAVPSRAEHPISRLLATGLRVTVNTDNRLMSGVSVTSELSGLVAEHGWGWDEAHTVTRNAIEASFASTEVKADVGRRIAAWFAEQAARTS